MSSLCPACSFEVQHGPIDYDIQLSCPSCGAPMLIVGANGTYQPKEAYVVPAEPDPEWLALVHALWEELHSFAFRASEEDWARGLDWLLESWLPRVPQFGCGCQQHFRELIQQPEHAPDFSSREAFFAWTWARHNEVNARLGKPFVELEAARQLYAP